MTIDRDYNDRGKDSMDNQTLIDRPSQTLMDLTTIHTLVVREKSIEDGEM